MRYFITAQTVHNSCSIKNGNVIKLSASRLPIGSDFYYLHGKPLLILLAFKSPAHALLQSKAINEDAKKDELSGDWKRKGTCNLFVTL